jgi:hypothetical protein
MRVRLIPSTCRRSIVIVFVEFVACYCEACCLIRWGPSFLLQEVLPPVRWSMTDGP